jgi:2-polyprenyl-6-methoxyphenol hydroxylase-like FAD-dependent oxidoreductase
MSKAQVLIVGAGPVGLMVATELLRKNVTVHIIDQVFLLRPITAACRALLHRLSQYPKH